MEWTLGELLNLVGLSSGTALYAMLLMMVVRARRGGGDPLLLATAILGLLWNLCALPAYELPKIGVLGPFPWLNAVGFSALGLLPAVVVHSVLRGERDPGRDVPKRIVAVVAYGVSLTAAALQFGEAAAGRPLPSVLAMQLLTYTFIALVIPLAVVTRRQPGARRALWAAALSIFAVSALHLSGLHRGDASWPIELLGHHASVPLAIAILYQDFPFAFADLFLKRALTLLALVTTAFVAVVSVGVGAAAPFQRAKDVAILVTLWVATALLYPRLRDATAWFVDTVLLDRPDYPSLLADIARRVQGHEDIAALLDDACAELAPALSASTVRWREHGRIDQRAPTDATTVEVPVAEPPHFALEVRGLTGGRRLLSDDRVALDAIALLLGRRIDAMRLSRERYERRLREEEMAKLATEAELRALRSQINPHFLFNALTTIGHLIQTTPVRALETLMRLTALLRGVLRSDGEWTTLGRELDLVEAYLDIERARFEERLRVRIDVPAHIRDVRVPPLILQPLVENAVKHGIASLIEGGEVSIVAGISSPFGEGAVLAITVGDTGAGASPDMLNRGRDAGVGLRNVERRLECQYGDAAGLRMTSVPGEGTTVSLWMPVAITRDAALARTAS